MGQDRHITGNREIEEEILQLRWRGVMRRLDQHVTRIGDRKEPPRFQSADKIGRHMNIGAGCEAERNSRLVESVLQLHGGVADARSLVVIKPRQNVRRTGDNRDTLVDRGPCHGE